MQYSWKIADNSEYPAIYQLLSPLQWGIDYIKRRVVDPLSIGHLVAFYNESGKLAGFLTLAFMNSESEKHQSTLGILPQDWKSGLNFWVVDLVAPEGGCRQMLKTIIKSLNPEIINSARYFRERYRQLREVRL